MKPKIKKCKNCGEPFIPFNSLQSACSPKCAAELAKKKEAEKKKRIQNLETKEMRIRAKSTDYKKELQKEVNKLARQIDERFQFNCIDCGKPLSGRANGAHYHSVGSHESTRFNLHNIHAARSECNRYSEDHKPGYEQGLVNRYGFGYLEMVENLPKVYPEIKLSPQDIYDKLKIVRRLNREFSKINFTSPLLARRTLNEIIGIYK